MKAFLDREGCIACELCPTTCPEVFRMAEDGLAEVYAVEIPKDAEDTAKEAEADCPANVIIINQ